MREIGPGLDPDALTDNVFAGYQIDASVAPLSLLLDQIFDFADFFYIPA